MVKSRDFVQRLCNVTLWFKLVIAITITNAFHGAAGRTRTDTLIRREILSLLCLPISPPRHERMKLCHESEII